MAIGVTRGLFACSVVVVMWVSGCTSTRALGSGPHDSTTTVNPRAATQPWVLIKNPRFGDVRGEPEYVWVEEDRIPVTLRTLLFGRASIVAPPEVVAKHGPPPGGGAISLLHGPLATPKPGAAPPITPPHEVKPAIHSTAPAPTSGLPARGYVVFVKKTHVLVDLTEKDGLRIGSILSIRQPLSVVHPVTGQLLGAYEDEVATARVIEVHGMFSVAEIEEVSPGVEVKVKDRVRPR